MNEFEKRERRVFALVCLVILIGLFAGEYYIENVYKPEVSYEQCYQEVLKDAGY